MSNEPRKWKVMPTGNKAGDLAIVPDGATKPIDRIATVKVRSGCNSLENARLIAEAPTMRALLRSIDYNMLIDDRRAGAEQVFYELRDVLGRIQGGAS